MNPVAYIEAQRHWSGRTFGPGRRTVGITSHIAKELIEIRGAPSDLEEWVDVIILALDGAWRAGHEPAAIVAMLEAKQRKNFARRWPVPQPEHLATEHLKDA